MGFSCRYAKVSAPYFTENLSMSFISWYNKSKWKPAEGKAVV